MTIHKISPNLKKSNTEREYLPTPTATVQNRKNIFLINTDKYKKISNTIKKKKPYLNLILKSQNYKLFLNLKKPPLPCPTLPPIAWSTPPIKPKKLIPNRRPYYFHVHVHVHVSGLNPPSTAFSLLNKSLSIYDLCIEIDICP